MFGDDDREKFLREVRSRFEKGKPITFVSDIVTATAVKYVVIESLTVEETGHRPDELDPHRAAREPAPAATAHPLAKLDGGVARRRSGLRRLGWDLDAIDAMSVPDFSDPTPPLTGVLDIMALRRAHRRHGAARRALRRAVIPSASSNASMPASGGTDLSVKVSVQTGQLGSLATTVRSLIANPPSSLDDLTASLGDLPAPALGVGTQFTGMLGDLRAAVPPTSRQ